MGARCILTIPLLSRTSYYYLDKMDDPEQVVRLSTRIKGASGFLPRSQLRVRRHLFSYGPASLRWYASVTLANLPPLISLIWPSVLSIIFMPQRPQSQVTLLSPVAPRSHPAARMMNWVGMRILIRGMCHQHRLPPRRKKWFHHHNSVASRRS